MKKTVFIILLIVIFIFGANLFFKNNTPANNEVVFWTLQLGTFDKYINRVISDFEKENPNIKIKWVDVPYSEGEKRTLAALLSDNPPDLINLTPDFSAMAAQKNALYEIPKEDLTDFPESLINSVSYNGKVFAFPFYLTSAITLVNSDLMKKAGIRKIPSNYDEMYSYAKQIREKTNAYAEMPTINENDTFLKILNKYGINIFENLNSKESQKIFEMYENLYKNNLIPKESVTQGHREALEKYMAGQIVFIQAGANFLNIIKENAPKVYENTIPSNQMTGSNNKYDFSLMNLIIPQKAKNKEYALKFAKYLTNEQNQLEFSKLTSVLPANKYALENDYFKKDGTKEELARKISASQISENSASLLNFKNKKYYTQLINTALVQTMTGKNKLDLNDLSRKFLEYKEK